MDGCRAMQGRRIALIAVIHHTCNTCHTLTSFSIKYQPLPLLHYPSSLSLHLTSLPSPPLRFFLSPLCFPLPSLFPSPPLSVSSISPLSPFSPLTLPLPRLVSYWEFKKEMAPGSEPPAIRELLAHIRPITSGNPMLIKWQFSTLKN